MTDDTSDHDRPIVDADEPSETASDGRSEQPRASHRSDRTPGETAERGDDRVEERLRAVERALTETDDAVADVTDEATATAERAELSKRLDDLEGRVEELEAATQAIRGYVGSVRAVNQSVERRADLALAKASENGGVAADDGATASDGEVANANEVGDTTGSGGLDGGVPSETDLDTAVPADRRRGAGAGAPAEPGADRLETDEESADDSWGSGALDRLRDSL
ncbi:DUF7310 family coiled-coil domain-containing protein [Halorubrum sp. FL23]|uniref:DUF7310 family coiled-coil domain-containing protein n=1 Tax=Halorubrum sp. FL23 TaxID=3458704 RepID=UPI00403391F7